MYLKYVYVQRRSYEYKISITSRQDLTRNKSSLSKIIHLTFNFIDQKTMARPSHSRANGSSKMVRKSPAPGQKQSLSPCLHHHPSLSTPCDSAQNLILT